MQLKYCLKQYYRPLTQNTAPTLLHFTTMKGKGLKLYALVKATTSTRLCSKKNEREPIAFNMLNPGCKSAKRKSKVPGSNGCKAQH